MAFFSRKTLFGLALGGLVSTTTAWSQEPTPAPGAPAAPLPAAADAADAPATDDRPGVIHVSDCPPADLAVSGSSSSGGHCHQHVPPHSGWNAPGRRPAYRSWVPYRSFFPASWTGATAVAPQQQAPTVYMPTDTTQLGYYYQHAPTWHAYSGMIPPVPRPADWHYPYYETQVCPPAAYGQPIHYGEPTVVPEQQTAPEVPTETGLDRSAARPQLAPIPQ